MRSEEEIVAQILHVAITNDKIRAVLLTGSRTDPNATKDRFQDFDIVYIVTQLECFVKDKHWIDAFGERLILQLPEEMTVGEKDNHAFHYLMLFKDGHRIDLTLFPINKLKAEFKRSSSTSVLLDKDNLFKSIPPPSQRDYIIKRPTDKEFSGCCNEFWWVSTYVSKGLFRDEVTYAKEMMDIPVRSMFFKMIEWYIGVLTDFTVSFGKGGRYMAKYLSPELYSKILSTYPDISTENIWKALFIMTQLFDELAREIAADMDFDYNKDEVINVTTYLKEMYELAKKK